MFHAFFSRNDRLFSRRNADDSDSEADTREMDSRMSIRNIDRCVSAVIVSIPGAFDRASSPNSSAK